MTEAKVRVDQVMGEIERDVRARLRRHLLKKGGAADYQDEEIFAAVHALLGRAIDARNLDATLLPELVDGDVDWRLQTHLTLTTHRPGVGRFILFAKKKLLCGKRETEIGLSAPSTSWSLGLPTKVEPTLSTNTLHRSKPCFFSANRPILTTATQWKSGLFTTSRLAMSRENTRLRWLVCWTPVLGR